VVSFASLTLGENYEECLFLLVGQGMIIDKQKLNFNFERNITAYQAEQIYFIFRQFIRL